MNIVINELFGKYNNFVLIGEAGSGKSELGINLAYELARLNGEREVHMYDMDQTKPLFRVRDFKESEGELPFVIHYQKQLMDSPTLVSGVEDSLTTSDEITILDVGGGEQGARMIGQFEEFMNDDNTVVLYIVNSFRPWSKTPEDIEDTKREVLGACGLYNVQYVANPNTGDTTEPEDILKGLEHIRTVLGIEPVMLCVREDLAEAVEGRQDLPVFPIETVLTMEVIEKVYSERGANNA